MMRKTKNNLPEATRKKCIGLLQIFLQSSVDLTYQSKQAHWNARGKQFIALHELFDKAAAAAAIYSDDLAERLVQLGGEAFGSIKQASKGSFLDDYPKELSDGLKHCEALSLAWAHFGSKIREAIDQATEFGDAGTADLFTGISRDVDKMLWFLEAHLESA